MATNAGMLSSSAMSPSSSTSATPAWRAAVMSSERSWIRRLRSVSCFRPSSSALSGSSSRFRTSADGLDLLGRGLPLALLPVPTVTLVVVGLEMSAAPELVDHRGARRVVLDRLLDPGALASGELRSRFGRHPRVVLRLGQQAVRELLVVELDVLFLAVDERLHRNLRHVASCSIPRDRRGRWVQPSAGPRGRADSGSRGKASNNEKPA